MTIRQSCLDFSNDEAVPKLSFFFQGNFKQSLCTVEPQVVSTQIPKKWIHLDDYRIYNFTQNLSVTNLQHFFAQDSIGCICCLAKYLSVQVYGTQVPQEFEPFWIQIERELTYFRLKYCKSCYDEAVSLDPRLLY